MKFDLVFDCNVVLAETPIWDARNSKLYWTDLFAGDVHEYCPATQNDIMWKTGKSIGTAVPCDKEGLFFVALEDGMFLFEAETGKLELIADPEPGRDENRYNDSRVDAAGRIFTSSVSCLYATDDYKPDMLGSFYMVDTDKTVHTIVEGINQYNAIVWNADNTKMFVVDTFNQTLLVFDYDIDSGPKGAQKVALEFGELGTPDGLSIDTMDNLYVCHWTGKISVWDKDLNAKEVWDFPVPQVCCSGFGGADMKEFYVATARYGYTPEQLENRNGAGGIFMGRNEVAGAADHFYKVK